MDRCEILPIGEQKRITYQCPKCKHVDLMDILAKMRVSRRVVHSLCCRHCHRNFIGVGRRPNYWRQAKKELHLTHAELRVLQKEFCGARLSDASGQPSQIVEEWQRRQKPRKHEPCGGRRRC
jgi:hypothetical protein